MNGLRPRFFRLAICLLLLGLAFAFPGRLRAQWATQSINLKSGWNAVYLQVDASYTDIKTLLSAGSPITDIWAWKPPIRSEQSGTTIPDDQWVKWSSDTSDVDQLTSLEGNQAILVHSSFDQVWDLKGQPVLTAVHWIPSAFNFVGFPTPADTPPSFADYFGAVPSNRYTGNPLDPARLGDTWHVYRYLPGEGLDGQPVLEEVASTSAATTLVNRGEAFWVQGPASYYNTWYGSIGVSCSHGLEGIDYGTGLGEAQIELVNKSQEKITVSLSLSASVDLTGIRENEPELLVRGNLNTNVLNAPGLDYNYTRLKVDGDSYSVEIAGNSTITVVLGLDRVAMTAEPGSQYAALLDIKTGKHQEEVGVSATVGSTAGLWVGDAKVHSIVPYAKTYFDASQGDVSTLIDAAADAAGLPANGAVWSEAWTTNSPAVSLAAKFTSVASSVDGQTLLVGDASNGLLFSTTGGTSWNTLNGKTNVTAVACSQDGLLMLAGFSDGSVLSSTSQGTNWSTQSFTNFISCLAVSADGRHLAAGENNGSLYLSADKGGTWKETNVGTDGATAFGYTSLALSEDGNTVLAAVSAAGGKLYLSQDAGKNWLQATTNLLESGSSDIKCSYVVCSADGMRQVALSGDGTIQVSQDGGYHWTVDDLAGATNGFTALAGSTDGLRLTALTSNSIYSSTDGGLTWSTTDGPDLSAASSYAAVALSGDASLLQLVNETNVYRLSRSFATYTVNSANGLVQDWNGTYISITNTTWGNGVASALPLRLILHDDGVKGEVTLLQRVYVGFDQATNQIVATSQSSLDPVQLASARRISAVHLPWSTDNATWKSEGSSLDWAKTNQFNVHLDYRDQASNPFLHTFHPDHDNLKADFETVQPPGVESYDIDRKITLNVQLSNTGTNSYTELINVGQARWGVYSETLSVGGYGGFSRSFDFSGSFSLHQISTITNLTEPTP